MQYIIRIYELKNKQKLQELVQVILKQKTLSMKDVIDGLQNPPLNVPIDSSPEFIVKLKNQLKALGAVMKVIIQEPNMPDSEIIDNDDEDDSFPAEHQVKPLADNGSSPAPPHAQKTKDTKDATHKKEIAETEVAPKFRYTPTPKKKGPSKVKQLIIFTIFLLPLILLILFYKEQTPSTVGAKYGGEVKVVTTTMAPLTGQKKADALYAAAIKIGDEDKSQNLLIESLEENPFNDKAWNELIKSYEESGDYGFAQRARSQKQKKSISIKKFIQSIALEVNRRNTRFTINSTHIKMDLSHIKSKSLFKSRAQEIYTLLKEQHPNKTISFTSRPLKMQLNYTKGTMKVTPIQ